jgi:hypothetical protein
MKFEYVYITFAAMAILLPRCSNHELIACGAEPPKETARPAVTILLVGGLEKARAGGLALFVDSKGGFTDVEFHKVTDEDLAMILHRVKPDADRSVHLFVAKGDEISLEILTKSLNRLKAAADPKKETTIYVYLKDLAK